MKNREEYNYESVTDYLHSNLSLIIAGPSCEEDRTHYIADQFRDSNIPIVYLDFENSTSGKYTISFWKDGECTKRKADHVNLHSILEQLPSISFKCVLVDITSMQHSVTMFLTYLLIRKMRVAQLFMSYVKPEEYLNRTVSGKYELYTSTTPPRTIPGMLARNKPNEIIIPFLGFDGDRFNNIIEGMNYDDIYPIIGFPSDNPYWHIESLRNCMLCLKNTSSEQNIRKCKANSIYDAYHMLEEIIAENPQKSFVLVPIGTRPHSVACAVLYARHANNVRIIYDFAEEAAVRSRGVHSVAIYNLSPFLA